MKLTKSSGELLCDNPVEITLEEENKFLVNDKKECSTLFKFLKQFDGKCGKYIVFKVTSPTIEEENCPPGDLYTGNVHIVDNQNNLICDNPVVANLSSSGHYQITNLDCEILFQSNKISGGKCDKYVIVTVKDSLFTEFCEEVDNTCNKTISFITPIKKVKIGDITRFLVTVQGGGNSPIEFQVGNSTWKPANLSLSMYSFDVNNTGEDFNIKARIKGCTETIQATLQSYGPDVCEDTQWIVTGNFYCREGVSMIEYISNCGNIKEEPGGNACNPECVPNWIDVIPRESRCVDNITEYKQTNQCDPPEYSWRQTGIPCGSGGGEDPSEGVNALMSYTLPSSNNRTNFDQFPDLSLPNNYFKIVAGHGFPFYGTTSVDAMNLIKKGWTNLFVAESYPRTPSPGWGPENLYSFNMVYRLMTIAARQIYKDSAYSPSFGNINGIAKLDPSELANPSSIDAHLDVGDNIDISGLTIAGANELGKRMYQVIGAATSIETPGQWNIPMTSSIIMLDEEHLNLSQTWEGGNTYTLLGYLSKGMSDEAANQGATNHFKLHWYGKPFNTFLNSSNYNNPLGYTKGMIEGIFDSYTMFDTPEFKAHVKYIDADGSYYKTPFIDNRYEIWQKTGASYTLSGGKRVPVNSDFNIVHFGKIFTIRKEPTIQVQTLLKNEITGQEVFCQATDPLTGQPYGTWDGTKWNINSTSYSNGWRHHNVAQPNSANWNNEVNYFIRNIYARADGIISGLMLAKAVDTNRTSVDIETPRFPSSVDKTFLGAVHRPQTENWSAYGNDHQVREVGPQGIIFDTLLALTSGIHLLDSWDDGHKLNYPLPTQGNPIYSPDLDNGVPKQDDFWGRWVVKNAAFQSFLKKVEGINPTTWKHIHFYYPFWGHKNYETIATGVYIGNRLFLLALNPYLGKDEELEHELKVGSSVFNLKLNGRDPVFLEYTVPTGLNATQFTLDYNNIYGVRIHVNGKLTKNIDDHYLS